MFKNYLKIAARNFLKHKAYSFSFFKRSLRQRQPLEDFADRQLEARQKLRRGQNVAHAVLARRRANQRFAGVGDDHPDDLRALLEVGIDLVHNFQEIIFRGDDFNSQIGRDGGKASQVFGHSFFLHKRDVWNARFPGRAPAKAEN